MTKFMNRSFSVGPKAGEKVTDTEWEIAVGLRCPKCTSKFDEGSTACTNPQCGETALENPLAEAAPVCYECGAEGFHKMSCDSQGVRRDVVAGAREEGLAIGYFDGGSSSNPGPGAAAWALEYPDRTTMTGVKGLGVVTNNEAEYVALIDLMCYAIAAKVERIAIYGDSQLIINQVLGKWKVKHADLKPLAETAKALAAQFKKFNLVWIPREENTQCDALVKGKIKEQK